MQTGDKTGIGLAVLGVGVSAVAMTIPLLFPEASHWVWSSVLAFGVVLILLSAVYLVRLHRESAKSLLTAVWHRLRPRAREGRYLFSKDEELGSAIKQMAWSSAWGKWFSAQLLAGQDRPIDKEAVDGRVMQIAASLVTDAAMDRKLEIRGRPPNSISYEVMPREAWRLVALHMRPDLASLWRAVVIPRGGAELVDGKLATQPPSRVAQILNYDSLVVDSRQFEQLWPKKDRAADRARRRFLRKAKQKGIVDRDIIRGLLG